MNIKATQLDELMEIIRRAQWNVPETYVQWHEDVRKVLKDSALLYEQDPPPTPPQPVPERKAIQVSQSFDTESNVDVTVALCNDGAILKFWSLDKGWIQLPPIPQPGES